MTEALTINISDNLATKADLGVMQAELKSELADVKVDIANLEKRSTSNTAELETKLTIKIAALETAMANQKAELIRWIVTTFAANVISMVTIAIAVVKLVAH